MFFSSKRGMIIFEQIFPISGIVFYKVVSKSINFSFKMRTELVRVLPEGSHDEDNPVLPSKCFYCGLNDQGC